MAYLQQNRTIHKEGSEGEYYRVLGEKAEFIGQRPTGCFWFQFENAATIQITGPQLERWFRANKVKKMRKTTIDFNKRLP